MSDAADVSLKRPRTSFAKPFFKDFADMTDTGGIQSRLNGPLEIIHRRSRIDVDQGSANPVSDVGKLRAVAGPMEREGVRVIDQVGRECGRVGSASEQFNRTRVVAAV